MNTRPPGKTLPPHPEVVKIEVSLEEIDRLDRVALDLEAAAGLLAPAADELGRVLKKLHQRLREARRRDTGI